jgi:phosphatidylglycerophosphate synthase
MANVITIARLPVLLLIVACLYGPNPWVRLAAVPLVGLLILMDSLDGAVARARKEVSLIGSVLDIMVDRAVELVLWICYADLRLVPLVIPLTFVLRGTIVDSLRSVHVGAGQTPFKSMRTPWGGWLVGSPLMRTTYAVSKLVAFAGLALTHALIAFSEMGAVSAGVVHWSKLIFGLTSWLAVILCLARGIPVIIEALLPLRGAKPQP